MNTSCVLQKGPRNYHVTLHVLLIWPELSPVTAPNYTGGWEM